VFQHQETGPLGITSWWPPAGPEVCFPNENSTVCSRYGLPTGNPFNPEAVPANLAIIDPLIGWEQQKFLIANTFIYLPENQKRYWLDRMELKELGISSDPQWDSRIELHLPGGSTYVGRTFGTEVIFGKTVQKGVAARVLEYANDLMKQVYVGRWHNIYGVTAVNTPNSCTTHDQCASGVCIDDGTGNNTKGCQSQPAGAWYVAEIDSSDYQPIVKFDLAAISESGAVLPNGEPGCSNAPGDYLSCTCEGNRACLALDKYKSLPWLLARMDTWIHVGAKALYPEAL